VITAQYSVSKSAYVATNPPSGYYLVSVIDADYFDVPNAAEVVFDGRMNVTVLPVDLMALPSKTLLIEVTVVDSVANPIPGAHVSVYDNTAHEFVSFATTATNITGKATISMFNTNLVPGHDFYMVVSKNMYETNATAVMITSSTPMTIDLVPSKRVTCFVTDVNGPAPGVVAYLINKDNSVPWVKRIMRVTGAAIAFDAYDGDFVFVVDAEGDAAYSQELTVTASLSLAILSLGEQTTRVAQNSITYGADFTSFTLDVASEWPYDIPHPGLMYNDMGNLRMQVDLVLGNGDGVLDGTEVDDFTLLTNSWGTEYVASDGLMLLNDTIYYSGSFTGYPYQLSTGTVMSMASVAFAYTCDYAALPGEIDVGADDYSATARARYDTPCLDNRYVVVLPAGHEMVANMSTSQVIVSGYTVIYIDPEFVETGGQEPVILILERSIAPVALLGLLTSEHAYAVLDSGGNVSRYIVAVGENVTLTGAGSIDPNGNPMAFIWDFGDATPLEVTLSYEIPHSYATSQMAMANLTVADVTGMLDWSEMAVVVDGRDPNPTISVQNKVLNTTDNSVTLDTGELLWLNATSSTDDALVADDGLGVIDYMRFDWGDGNSSGMIQWTAEEQNVSHAYQGSGSFVATLNVTDVVGHWKNATILVKVFDITPPTPVAVIEPNPVMIGQEVWFDAANSTGSGAPIVSYIWTFEDNGEPVELSGVNVSHVFTTGPQIVTVTLNCTDAEGHWATTDIVLNVSGEIPEFPTMLIPAVGCMSVLLMVRPLIRRCRKPS
jgi:hypothetical protein